MKINSFHTVSMDMMIYQENYNYINYSKHNIKKYKFFSRMFFSFINNRFVYKNFIINNIRFLSSIWRYPHMRTKSMYLRRKLMLYLNACLYGSKGRIKMIGRGFKITKIMNGLVIRLGYSHLPFIHLIPNMKMKTKKKKMKFYTFHGPTYDMVNYITTTLHIMRLPDLYTDKGVFHRRIHLQNVLFLVTVRIYEY